MRASTKASPRRVGFSALGARRGSSSAMPSLRARQLVISGQITQRGLRGVHTVAPRSIIAWA